MSDPKRPSPSRQAVEALAAMYVSMSEDPMLDNVGPVKRKLILERDAKTVTALYSLLDYAETTHAKCNAVMKDRASIVAERDRTFALMLARAEAAESRVKELEDCLKECRSR